MGNEIGNTSQFLFYASDDGGVKVQVIVQDETVWATQKGMAEIFDVEPNTITYHLKNIFVSKELESNSVTRKIRATAADGKSYLTSFYNLDAIISVGYRVNSSKATTFRKWATGILKEYLIKGFAMNDDRLKQGGNLFGKDYFNELLERIREIRASERRFYQKITDLYAQASIDYDKDAPITHTFYASVQNKFHYAIHGHTAAELIQTRANASKPNFGLTSWKNEHTRGKVLKSDVNIAKNYLTEDELKAMNRVVSQYLDFAEGMAERQKAMTMADWVRKLDDFLQFNEYGILSGFGKVSASDARKFAEQEFDKFRIIQDGEFKSDFDKVVEQVNLQNKLPSPKNRKK